MLKFPEAHDARFQQYFTYLQARNYSCEIQELISDPPLEIVNFPILGDMVGTRVRTHDPQFLRGWVISRQRL